MPVPKNGWGKSKETETSVAAALGAAQQKLKAKAAMKAAQQELNKKIEQAAAANVE